MDICIPEIRRRSDPKQKVAVLPVRVLTASEFACERLGFVADEKQRAVLDSDCEAGHFELFAAVGEVDGDGGEGGPPGVDGAGEFGVGGESDGAAEPGVSAESGGLRAAAGDRSARGWGQSRSAVVSEWEPDCGAAGEGGDGAGIFQRCRCC